MIFGFLGKCLLYKNWNLRLSEELTGDRFLCKKPWELNRAHWRRPESLPSSFSSSCTPATGWLWVHEEQEEEEEEDGRDSELGTWSFWSFVVVLFFCLCLLTTKNPTQRHICVPLFVRFVVINLWRLLLLCPAPWLILTLQAEGAGSTTNSQLRKNQIVLHHFPHLLGFTGGCCG